MPVSSREESKVPAICTVFVGPRPTVVSAAGELDIATTVHTDAIFTAASSGTQPQVVIDLRQVTFLDCAGARPVVTAARRIREAGGSLTLLAEHPMVLKVLRLHNLTPDRVPSDDGAVPAQHSPAFPPVVLHCNHRCRPRSER
ncbi:STAS domain-containing protein [Streptomyces sp. NPDC046978]|uniref:STAS domain-containing protein n=1 Tax=unclassified Streptomyces TaxID=2593676 RepID=UPI0033C21758